MITRCQYLLAQLTICWQCGTRPVNRLLQPAENFAAHFFYVEGGSLVSFAFISLLATCPLLPLNIYEGVFLMEDQSLKTIVNHNKHGSLLLWVQVLFMVVAVVVVHYCIRTPEA